MSAFENDVRSSEQLAQTDPFRAVPSGEESRHGAQTPEAEGRVKRSGEEHLVRVISIVRSEVDPGFEPGVSPDLGCGVGRNPVPLAGPSRHAVGIDASATMVERADR